MSLKNFRVNVSSKNQFIEIKLMGVVQLETLRGLVTETERLKNSLENFKKEIKVLTEVSEVESVSIHSRKYGSEWLSNHPEYKIAFYGQSIYMKYILSAIIKINKADSYMKFFSSKDEAISWLIKT